MKALRGAVLALATTLMLIVSPGVAQAAALEVNSMTGISSHRTCTIFIDHPAGDACFAAYGDVFYMFGYNSDYRLALHWKLGDGSRQGLIRWRPTEEHLWGVKNKNFYEGKNIAVRFGICSGGGCDRLSEVDWQTGFKWGTTG